jgi:hypothetical protein
MKHIKIIPALLLILFSINTFAVGVMARPAPCQESECKEILDTLSGGNTDILMIEIIAGTFIILFLVMRIYERWFK